MILRELKEKDAEYMLEWMHDANVYSFLGRDFSSMTLKDCKLFIEKSVQNPETDRHYAIIDENDEYMGTISLKNIEWEEKRAEYAISCRTKAMGRGFAKRASEELFRIASVELGLHLIYLYVRPDNIRAQKLYQKLGFENIKKPAFIKENIEQPMLWFQKIV